MTTNVLNPFAKDYLWASQDLKISTTDMMEFIREYLHG